MWMSAAALVLLAFQRRCQRYTALNRCSLSVDPMGTACKVEYNSIRLSAYGAANVPPLPKNRPRSTIRGSWVVVHHSRWTFHHSPLVFLGKTLASMISLVDTNAMGDHLGASGILPAGARRSSLGWCSEMQRPMTYGIHMNCKGRLFENIVLLSIVGIGNPYCRLHITFVVYIGETSEDPCAIYSYEGFDCPDVHLTAHTHTIPHLPEESAHTSTAGLFINSSVCSSASISGSTWTYSCSTGSGGGACSSRSSILSANIS